MKLILGALAAITLLVGIGASQPAEARCFWNGFETVCVRHAAPWWWHRPHYGYAYHAYRPYWWGGY
jgi:hypothetical protein